MTYKSQHLMLPVAAVAMSMLAGCSSMGNLLGSNQPVLSPAAKAAAEMPLEKDPVVNTQDTYLALVKQMQAKSLWYASIAHLDALDKQWGVSSESRLLRADALRQTGQLNAAVTMYQGLLGSANDGFARYGLGRVAAEKGDFRQAALQMEKARMSNPVDSRLLTDLGYAYLRAHDLNAARTPLMQAAQLNPEDAQANVNLSLFMMVSGQSAQAEEFMRQRKLDGQTQQAVKEQASEWLKGAKQAASLAVTDPATQAMGRVVNLSRPEATAPEVSMSKSVMPAASTSASAAVEEETSTKKSAPESESAQAPVVVVTKAPESMQALGATGTSAVPPLPLVQPVMAQSAERMPSGGQWMVSGSSFDAGRPRYPGQAPQVSAHAQTYAYALPESRQAERSFSASTSASIAPTAVAATAPLPTISESKHSEMLSAKAPSASVSVAKAIPKEVAVSAPSLPVKREEIKPAQPLMTEALPLPKLAPVHPALVPHVAPSTPQPTVPRQPSGPARSLQEGTVVMAVASPAVVRQGGNADSSKQEVQAMLPRRAATGGLFFESPDEETGSKSTPAAKAATPERVWP